MRQGAYKTIHSFFSHPDFGHSLIIAASLYCWFRSCEGLFITIFALTESAAKMRVADGIWMLTAIVCWPTVRFRQLGAATRFPRKLFTDQNGQGRAKLGDEDHSHSEHDGSPRKKLFEKHR